MLGPTAVTTGLPMQQWRTAWIMQKVWAAVAIVRECPDHGLVVADPEQG